MNNKLSLLYLYLLFAIAFLFALHNSYNYPVSDAFYYIKSIIIPLHNDQLEFRDLFLVRNSMDHQHLLYKLFLILNYKIFNLNFRIELVFGLIGMLFCCLLIINKLRKDLSNENNLLTLFIQILIIINLISYNEYEHLSWTLVTFQYWMIFLVLLFFYLIDKMLIKKDVINTQYKFYLMVILTLLGSSFGEIAVILSIAVFILFGLIMKEKRFFLISAIIFLIFIFVSTFIFLLKSVPVVNKGFNYNIVSIGVLQFILYLLGQGLISVGNLKNIFNIDYHNISFILGFLVFLTNIYVVFIYFRSKLYLSTTYPFLLLLFSYVLLLGLIWTRFRYFGSEYAFQPRYVLLMEFNIISLLWILGIYFLRNHVFAFRYLYILIGSIIILMQIGIIPIKYKTSKWIIKYHKNEEKEVRMLADSEIEKASMPRINVYGAKEVSRFLKENHLSLFDGEF